MRHHSRPSRRPLAALVLAAACGCGAPSEKVTPGSAAAITVPAQAASTAPGFADQGGDALLISGGALARVRLDGSLGPLESHPGNPQPPGEARAVYPLGPHQALLVAANGLYLVQSGWILSPPWGAQLDPAGVRGATDAGDGSAWLAHDAGLFRLKDGLLSELKVSGRSVSGLTAVVAARAEDGVPGVWFSHAGGLSVVVSTDAGLRVRQATLAGAGGMKLQTLAALGDSAPAASEVWALASDGELYRDGADGWHRLELPDQVGSLAAAGRAAWVTLLGKRVPGQPLLRFDADSGAWEQLSGLSGPARVLAADASGAAWVMASDNAGAAGTFQVSRARAPRVHGLDQNMKVPEGELVVMVSFPPGSAPTQVRFTLDDAAPVAAVGPLYSLGGLESDGTTPRSYSFVGLSAGMHKLKVSAAYADGTAAERVVPYEFQPVSRELLSWDKDIRPIHESRCAKCHVSGPGPDYSTFALWKANAPKIVNVLREGRMPADGPLEPDRILKVQRWVQGGLLP